MCVCVRPLRVWSRAPAGSTLLSCFAQDSLGKLFLVKLRDSKEGVPLVAASLAEGWCSLSSLI